VPEAFKHLVHCPAEPLPPWSEWGQIHSFTRPDIAIKFPRMLPPRIKKMTNPVWPPVPERPSNFQSPADVERILRERGVLRG
jgi:hypothetical protein